MKLILIVLMLFSASVFAQTTSVVSCEVTNFDRFERLAGKVVNVQELTDEELTIGVVEGTTVTIKILGYYNGEVILSLAMEKDGKIESALGTGKNLIGIKSQQLMLSVFCREMILE